MTLAIEGVVKAFGPVRAVDGVSLSVGEGEFFTLLGPSGCGKTTLLRIIAGIYRLGEGRVLLNGRDITRLPMHARRLGMVFQSYALFPHLTAFENIAFGLRSRGLRNPEIKKRVAEALALVRLEGLAARYPAEMSGGQQQRVALARALVIEPDLLLLDEPLSNLDARLRGEMRAEIRDLQRRLGITTVLVTHDIDEAFAMSDRIGVMQAGRIVQVGAPAEIYRRPVNRFVARFVGAANELPLEGPRLSGDAPSSQAQGLSLRLPRDAAPGAASLIIRPEHVIVQRHPGGAENSFAGEIEDIVFLGGSSECRVRIGSMRLTAMLPSAAAVQFKAGEAVTVGWDPNDAVVVSAE